VLGSGPSMPWSVWAMPKVTAGAVVAVVWGGAVAGVGLMLAWSQAQRWPSAPLYVALGWVALAVLPDLLRAGGVAPFVLLLAGGVGYTTGALCYALRRPNPWPAVFGHHEFFHAFTLVAALCHHIAVYLILF